MHEKFQGERLSLRGRPSSVSYPDGATEAFEYNGNGTRAVRHVDALGREDVYKWVLGLPVHAEITGSDPIGGVRVVG